MNVASVPERLTEAKRTIASKTNLNDRTLGIVLGSGLGKLTQGLRDVTAIDYQDIPHLPKTGIQGHDGKIVFGELAGRQVICLSGRCHFYEGHSPDDVVFGVRLLATLGVDTVLLTNAAGGFGPGCTPGTLMTITDHLNLTGRNPLVGKNQQQLGPRFPDMSVIYDPKLVRLIASIAKAQKIQHAEGVYAGVLGPSYETPAEIRMLETLGASAVGMSTVFEAIALSHMSIRVAGISCITNYAAGKSKTSLNHQEVAEVAARASGEFCALVSSFCERLPPRSEEL